MSRTYDESVLTRMDPQDITWARTWVRNLLRDKPIVGKTGLPAQLNQPVTNSTPGWDEGSLTDEAINAALRLRAVGPDSDLYYRPHVTAADLLRGNPNILVKRVVDGSSEQRRDPNDVAISWIEQGRGIDAMIPSDLLPAPIPQGDKPVVVAVRAIRPMSVVINPWDT